MLLSAKLPANADDPQSLLVFQVSCAKNCWKKDTTVPEIAEIELFWVALCLFLPKKRHSGTQKHHFSYILPGAVSVLG
jgi:hypothetical protein